MGLIPVALAVIVLAFSLHHQQAALQTTLAPDAFNGQYAYSTMQKLAASYPNRRPGSFGDDALASYVAAQLRGDGFVVTTDLFRGRTAVGTRTLENVVGLRAGLESGSIVVVAHRDALGSPADADLSGTAVLLDLARVLSGETQHRSVVLASTSGSTGAIGALRLARQLARPIDAVLVLGDLAGTRVRQPVVVPWSNGQQLAPPVLRTTLAAALQAQASLPSRQAGLAGQFAHLAFPFAASELGPFAPHGLPTVLLSVSGERAPASGEPTSPERITAMGRTVLQAMIALDSGPSVPAPSSYLLYDGKVVPAWAIRLLVLALILPVLGATVDGLARARRRGHSITRWAAWVLAAAVPLVLGVLVVFGGKLAGLIDIAPPGPVGAGAVPLHGGGIAVLALIACALVVGFAWLRPLMIRLLKPGGGGPSAEPYGPGAAAGLLVVLCVVSLAIWITNPFAAALLVPAMHLWMWIVVPDVRLRAPVAAALFVAGLAPPVLVALYYALTLGLGPVGAAWNAVLLIAGGQVGVVFVLEGCVAIACAVSVAAIAVRAARQPRPEETPVTIRGPVTYAGPGSLGGTESALRR